MMYVRVVVSYCYYNVNGQWILYKFGSIKRDKIRFSRRYEILEFEGKFLSSLYRFQRDLAF